MYRMHGCVLAVLVASGLVETASPLSAAEASHQQVREIPVAAKDGISLQTLALAPDGRLLALVAPARYGEPQRAKPAQSEVRVFDEEGKQLARWAVQFQAQSIGVGPDGTVFVGGDGRLAKFNGKGEQIAVVDLPHLKELLADNAKLREQAVEMRKSLEDAYKDIAEQFNTQKQQVQEKIDALKKKPAEKLTAADKRRLERYEEQVKELAEQSSQFAIPSIEDMMQQLSGRLRLINGVTVTARDVFVVTGESKGHGYAVWRMDHRFQEPKQVLSGLAGCCGQMDVQADGDELFVAENCSHRVGRYTRDGEKVASFGQKTDENAERGFGGCCNPMNLRVGKDGKVYTAESEGIIRCFSTSGEYQCLVGTTHLSGGCKNVAVAVSTDSSKVYFCDQPGERIIVLARKAEKPDNDKK